MTVSGWVFKDFVKTKKYRSLEALSLEISGSPLEIFHEGKTYIIIRKIILKHGGKVHIELTDLMLKGLEQAPQAFLGWLVKEADPKQDIDWQKISKSDIIESHERKILKEAIEEFLKKK